MQILDMDKTAAWRATLSAKERALWDKMVELLEGCSPEMRWRLAGLIMERELQHARHVLRVARNVRGEGFKADLVQANGVRFREAVENLEQRVADLAPLVEPAIVLVRNLERGVAQVKGLHLNLSTVMAASTWAAAREGAAKGRGVPGYDTEQGVERARQEAQAAHARWQERQGNRKPRKRQVRHKGRTRSGGPMFDNG